MINCQEGAVDPALRVADQYHTREAALAVMRVGLAHPSKKPSAAESSSTHPADFSREKNTWKEKKM